MDFLVQKWKLWYGNLDVNHDGKISFEDVEESRNKFTDLHKLLGDKAKGVKVDMEKWWNTYIFRKQGAEISEEDFIKDLSNRYNTDKAAFEAEMTDCFNMIFDVIDTNKDRSIELDEFIFAFKAFGHENESVVTKVFTEFKPTGGLVPLRDIVNAWIDFVTSNDSSKECYIKKAFES